jgi:UMF1 family MFS transporter
MTQSREIEPVATQQQIQPPGKKEILAWASYDIANATYATVIATAVYNAYYVKEIAGRVMSHASATFWLTSVISISSILIVLSAPIVGTIADATASKKKLLAISTWICIIATACLSLVTPGHYVAGAIILTIACVAFGTGEDLIAAFLPELASKEKMGRISALGWAAGYIGGLISLGGCMAYVLHAQKLGQVATDYVPVVIVLCASAFAIASLPTFLILKERAIPDPNSGKDYIRAGFRRFAETVNHAKHYKDLFRFLLSLFTYSCGTTTVIHLASVYAQEVMGFTASDSIKMILVVNVTAAIGAFVFGWVQDKIGSIKTLVVTLSIWTIAIITAVFAHTRTEVWIAANIIGTALGASGSAGRALVGQFSPPGRSGEFLGLWGVSVKLATAVGVSVFGAITWMTGSNYRAALAFTLVFFVVGILLLFGVDEKRGWAAAHEPQPNND